MMTRTQPQNSFSYIILPANQLYVVSTKENATKNLLELLQQRSQKGFSILYDNYAASFYCVLCRIVKRKEIAEDLLQDSFVKIWKKIDTYDETKGTLYTWMLNIARNTGIDYIRSNKNEFYKQVVNDNALMNESLHPETEILNTNRLDSIVVKNKAASLDEKYAEVINLIYFEGCTYEQTAKILKLPLGTVKTRGRMALTILKKGKNEY